MDSYADADDLAAWINTTAPDNADRRLRSATIRVARACNLNPYDTPASSSVQPLQDATCAQAASWIALGIDPDAGGLDVSPVKKSSMLGDSVERDTSGQAPALAAAAADLCTEACDILLQANLLWLPTPQWSDSGLASWGLPERPASSMFPPPCEEIVEEYAAEGGTFGWPFL